MTDNNSTMQNGIDTEPLRQDSTQHELLGVDDEGRHHVFVDDRQRVVVIDAGGIHHQHDLAAMGRTKRDWMAFVDSKDAWAHRQLIGDGLVEALQDTMGGRRGDA